jgi:hypothetical protein
VVEERGDTDVEPNSKRKRASEDSRDEYACDVRSELATACGNQGKQTVAPEERIVKCVRELEEQSEDVTEIERLRKYLQPWWMVGTGKVFWSRCFASCTEPPCSRFAGHRCAWRLERLFCGRNVYLLATLTSPRLS